MRNLLSIFLLITGTVLCQTESQGVDFSTGKGFKVARFDRGKQANIQFPESFTVEMEEEEQACQCVGTSMLPGVQITQKESKNRLVGHCNNNSFKLSQQQSGQVSDPSPPV